MENRKTVFKWFWAWDFEKEECWLNEMASEGWALESVGFCKYNFVKCEPGEYIIRLETREKDDGYTRLLEEMGAEYIGRVAQWVYYKRKSELGPFNLFSDIDSRIEHLERICKVLRAVGFANILIGVANTFNPSHIGFLNLLCACLLMYGLGRLRGKEEELKKERVLHE